MRPTTREETGATYMLRCAELQLDTETLDNMSMGMVYDLLIERGNDNEKYAIKGTPGGLRAFFGGGG